MNFDLIPKDEDFEFFSDIHGVSHVKRVMNLVIELGKLLPQHQRQVELAYHAAYIHDMARDNDGLCYVHGHRSKLSVLPRYIDLFKSRGITDEEIEEIGYAVTMHSVTRETDIDHPYYITTSILKDADGLDRVRLGDLDPKYLRFKESHKLINFAHKQFNENIL